MSVRIHLEAAAAYIAVAESGDAKREAYVKAADEILAAMKEDSALSQAEVSRHIGKSRDWVSRLLAWRTERRSGSTPFARDPENDFRARSEARKVPTRHEDRIEMVEKLLEDPKVIRAVVKTHSPVAQAIKVAVYDAGAEQRKKDKQAKDQLNKAAAMPLPAYMSKMVEKINEWALGMAGITNDDLGELPEGRARELVGIALDNLEDQIHRWRSQIERQHADVIEIVDFVRAQ